MTEFDYSPEAYEKYLATQRRIASWVHNTQAHAHEFDSVVPPISAAKLKRRISPQPGAIYAPTPGPMPMPTTARHLRRAQSFSDASVTPSQSASQVAAQVAAKEYHQQQQQQLFYHHHQPQFLPHQHQQMAMPMMMYASPPPSPLATPPPPMMYPNQMPVSPLYPRPYPYASASSPTPTMMSYGYQPLQSPSYVMMPPPPASAGVVPPPRPPQQMPMRVIYV